jgi:hypothetical protein
MAGPFRSRAALQTRIRRVPERPTPKLTGRAEASRDAFRGEAIRKDQTEPGDAGMELHAIFTKTPRGITEVKTRAAKLPRNLLSILALVDGKSTLDRLLRESKLAETKFCQAISRLEEEGFIKVFAAGPGVADTPAPVSRPRRLPAVSVEGLDELDFSAITRTALEEKTDEGSDHAPGFRLPHPCTPSPETASPVAQARAAAESEARRIAEEALKAQAAAEAKARADEEARVRAEAQARAESEARARMAAEAEARSKADARARLEAHMKAEAERKARTEAERRAEEERQAREALEARLEAEQASRAAAEQRAREEAERKAREETEARLAEEVRQHKEGERRAREETERKAKEELEARLAEERRAREEAERRAREEAEQKARAEMEAKLSAERKAREELEAQLAAEQRAKEEAEQRVREAVERQAQEESERQSREEAERLAHEESERRAREAFESTLAAERRAREEAERRAEEEHDLRQREEAERRAQEEADRKAREDTERRAVEEAEQRVREEAAHKAREAAERRMREDLEATLAAERKAREDAERRAEEEASARARKEREDAEREAEGGRREVEAVAETGRCDAAEDARETPDQESSGVEPPAVLDAHEAPEVASLDTSDPAAATHAARSAEGDPVQQAGDVAPFFEIDLDALDARERALRAEEEEKLKLEAERHARELELKDEAEREARAAAARLEREAEDNARRTAAEAERMAQEEERRRLQDDARRRREEEDERLREEAARQARLEQEQRMREEAERRDREEAAARAQAEAERKTEEKLQKKRAKEEEKARKRAAAEEKARARDAAKVAATHTVRGAKQPARWRKAAAVSAALTVVAAIALLHVLPWNGLAPGMEQLASGTVGEPVKIGSVRAGLFPSPHFELQGVVVGKEQDVKIASVRAVPELSSLFSERKILSSLELNSATAEENVLRRIPAWVKPQSGKPLRVAQVVLRDVKLAGGAIAVPPFSGDIGLDAAGAFSKAVLRSEDGKLTVELRNKPERLEADFAARGWKSPFGPGIEFDEIAGKAVLQGTDITLSDVTARLYGGTATGHATVAWNGPWTLAGDFSAHQLDLATTLKAFTSQFRATGQLAANGRYSAQAASFDRLFAEPVVDAGFKAERGELENVDLTRALQQAAAGTPVRGGKTQFAELSGTVKVSGKSYHYRQLALSSGILRASGNTEMAPSGELAGRLNVELAAKPNPIRALIALSGKLSDPQLKASR